MGKAVTGHPKALRLGAGLAGLLILVLGWWLPASAAGPWTRHRVDNLTIQIPPHWRTLPQRQLRQSPFKVSWFVGDVEEPDAGVGIFPAKLIPQVKEKLASYKYTTTTVDGRPAKQYLVDFLGGGKSTAYVTIVSGAAAGGGDVAIMHFAPTKTWAAQKATLERIMASIRFGQAGAPPVAKPRPAATAGSWTRYQVSNITIMIPPGWQRLFGRYLKKGGLLAGWYLGNQRKPDAAVGIYLPAMMPKIKRVLVKHKYTAATLGGRPAKRYSFGALTHGKDKGFVTVVVGAAPGGSDWVLVQAAPAKTWAANQAILERIMASIRFGQAAADPSGVKGRPASPPAVKPVPPAVKPTPPAASHAARLSIDKRVYAPGETIRVTFQAPPAYHRSAWVGIIPSRVPHGREIVNDRHDIAYHYLEKRTSGVMSFRAPSKPGSYDLRMNDTDSASGHEVASVSFRVAAGAQGSSTTSNARPHLRMSRSVYRSDQPIDVFFSGFPGNPKDWITLARVDWPDKRYGQWSYLAGKKSGTLHFHKLPPGRYQARGFLNWPAGGYKVVVRANFTVVAAPKSPPTTTQGSGHRPNTGNRPAHPAPPVTSPPPARPNNRPSTNVATPPTTTRTTPPTTIRAMPPTTRPVVDYASPVAIRLAKPVFRPDEPIVAHVSGLPPFKEVHVSIGPAGAARLQTHQNIKTQAKTAGTFSFKPRPVGNYRIIVWPDPNKMGYSILKTAAVQVKAPPLVATIEQPKVEYNTGQKRIKVTVRPKSLVLVPAVLVAVPGGAPSSRPGRAQVKFQKRLPGLKSAPVTVDAVVSFKPGRYEWRLYQPGIKGRLVARLPFTVVPLGPNSPRPDDLVRLPFSDRFSPSAACWRTEGLAARVKDSVLTVNTSRQPLRTAFSIPLENISVYFKFRAAGEPVSAHWGAVPGQGYGLRITPSGGDQATAAILADGMRKTLASATVPLRRGAWHRVYLRRTGDELQLRINGRLVAQAKTARRYQGGAPLSIQGGKSLALAAVEVLYPRNAPHSGGYQKRDGRFCRCGPRVLENWLGGLQQNGWRVQRARGSDYSVKFFPSATGGARALRTRQKAKSPCRMGSVRAVFAVGKANSSTAYLETYLVMGLGRGDRNFPHLLVELLDDKGKVLGRQRYYAPDAVSPASRANAERRKYAKLSRTAGVVRLYLKEVKPNIEFSRIAISVVSYVCDGDNDITLDQIIFCPSADCRLGLTEKVDPAAVLAGIERAFVDFKITRDELMRYFLDPPRITPSPQPPLGPAPTSRLKPALYLEPPRAAAPMPLAEGSCACTASRLPWRRAAATTGCDQAVQRAIDQMRRIKVSLGHDNQLKQALWGMAQSLAKDLDLSPGKLKKAQEWIGKAMDEGEWYYQLHGEVKSGQHNQAVQRVALAMFKRLHKRLLDECDSSLQLKKYSKSIRTAWARSLKKLPPKLRRAELARLKAVLGSKLSDEQFHRWIEQKGFDMAGSLVTGGATSAGQAAGRQYKAALCTLLTTTATTFSPQVRLVKAALTTYYESLRALRDWITDDTTQNLYDAYRKWYDQGQGGQDFFNAFSMRDRYPLHKVRQALAKKRGTTYDKVSDDDAWKFLMGQFAKWREAEKKSEQKADGLRKIKAEFMSLSAACRRGLDRKLWPKGKYGLTHAYRRHFDPCYYDIEALKRYAQIRQEVMSRLLNWYRPQTGCSGRRFLEQKAAFLTCKLLADGEGSYRRHMAYILDNCKWLPRPLAVIKAQNLARLAPRLKRMSEFRLQALLRGIGRSQLLNCLCRTKILMGVDGGYAPKPMSDSPSCKKVSNGLCAFGSWGCSRFPVPTSVKALKHCGVFDAVLQWQLKRRKGPLVR